MMWAMYEMLFALLNQSFCWTSSWRMAAVEHWSGSEKTAWLEFDSVGQCQVKKQTWFKRDRNGVFGPEHNFPWFSSMLQHATRPRDWHSRQQLYTAHRNSYLDWHTCLWHVLDTITTSRSATSKRGFSYVLCKMLWISANQRQREMSQLIISAAVVLKYFLRTTSW